MDDEAAAARARSSAAAGHHGGGHVREGVQSLGVAAARGAVMLSFSISALLRASLGRAQAGGAVPAGPERRAPARETVEQRLQLFLAERAEIGALDASHEPVDRGFEGPPGSFT